MDAISLLAAGIPAVAIALFGWLLNRRDMHEQIVHLRAENERLTQALQVSLYGRRPAEERDESYRPDQAKPP